MPDILLAEALASVLKPRPGGVIVRADSRDTATSGTATPDTATSDDGVLKELDAAIQWWVDTR
ncbi:hypothetical protein [Streptomyces iranensis]|uniref:hypothetical protein n=1 Tax=Streptomyces iranensis TaxID=576784 RepID=UPI0039B77A3C